MSYEEYLLYKDADAKRFETDDFDTRSIVSQILSETVKRYKENSVQSLPVIVNRKTLTVKINTGLISRYRKIYVYDEELQKLIKSIFNEDKYGVFKTYGEVAQQIYLMMKEELMFVRLEELRQAFAQEKQAPMVLIKAKGNISSSVYVEMPLTKQLTPKAFALFEKQLDMADIKEDFLAFRSFLSSQTKSRSDIKINLHIYEEGHMDYVYETSINSVDFYNTIDFLNRYITLEPIPPNTSYAEIEVILHDDSYEVPFTYNYIINIKGFKTKNLPDGAKKVD